MDPVVALVGISVTGKMVKHQVNEKADTIIEEDDFVAINNIIYPHLLYHELHLVDNNMLEQVDSFL